MSQNSCLTSWSWEKFRFQNSSFDMFLMILWFYNGILWRFVTFFPILSVYDTTLITFFKVQNSQTHLKMFYTPKLSRSMYNYLQIIILNKKEQQKHGKIWDWKHHFFSTLWGQTWVLRHAMKKFIPWNILRIARLS